MHASELGGLIEEGEAVRRLVVAPAFDTAATAGAPGHAHTRLELFSDGVFAIALTLLVIDIKVPPEARLGTSAEVWRALGHLVPSVFTFVLSFGSILIAWVNHHALLKRIHGSSVPFIYANGFLLLTIVFLPFPTALLGETLWTDHASPGVVLYCATIALQSVGWSLLARTALGPEPLTRTDREAALVRPRRAGRRSFFRLLHGVRGRGLLDPARDRRPHHSRLGILDGLRHSPRSRSVIVKILKRVLGVLGLLLIVVLGTGATYAGWQAREFDASMDRVYAVPVPDVTISKDPAVLARGEHLTHSVMPCAIAECHGPDFAGATKGPRHGPARPVRRAEHHDGEPRRGVLGRGALPAAAARGQDGRPQRALHAGAGLELAARRGRGGDDSRTCARVPPVDRPNGSSEIRTLGKILDRRGAMPLDVARRIDHEHVELAPAPSPTKDYGRFVARLCTGCHGEHLSGGPLPGAPPSIARPAEPNARRERARRVDVRGLREASGHRRPQERQEARPVHAGRGVLPLRRRRAPRALGVPAVAPARAVRRALTAAEARVRRAGARAGRVSRVDLHVWTTPRRRGGQPMRGGPGRTPTRPCREASTAGPLDADDVERLAWSAALTGQGEGTAAAFERLHQLSLDAGDVLRAARAAFWLAMSLFPLGEKARASGWLARAQRLVDGEGRDCVESGYLKIPVVFRLTSAGDHEAARAVAAEAASIGDRHGDRDLSALARSLEGRALIRQGRLPEGMLLVDEAMVDVTREALSPLVTGLIYCGVIAVCQQSYALDRAREWTAALGAWCQEQPQLVPFAGACLIHRSEIMQLGGAWPEAAEEARQASTRLSGSKDFEAGNAFYQEGELHRLRGELAEAEKAYALASERGRDPQPGLALLRVVQGRVDLAAAATRRVLSATSDPLQRARFLPAHVEVMLAASDLGEARRASDELGAIAERLGMEILAAIAQHAAGSVALAEGDARGALEPLRRAREVWQRVGAPYLGARVRVVATRAFQALGDQDGAALELDAAKRVFVQLGAAPDVAALEAIEARTATGRARAGSPAAEGPARLDHGLSARELEVLRLVASGKTNKQIGRDLFVSEKTVNRHVSNIFAKLDVPSRSAATAWAYRHGLVD